ncbi:MAG: thiol-disulfide isomerase [Acidobacteria bacterium]|nr:thiol-disulfide isomerase [Acidobacteriota bacterium]
MAASKVEKNAPVTYTKDVAPILQKRCQGCHRPGEAAPMALLNYQQARPWAKAMKEAVLMKRMPPWFADPHFGKFSNDRSLAQAEIDTLVAWADSGAKEGEAKHLPKPAVFLDGWNIGQPDAEFAMPESFAVAPSGTIEYQYIVIPTGFTEDKWVTKAEVRPGNRAVVHHVIAFVREPGSKWLREAKPGVPFVPEKRKEENRGAGERRREEGQSPSGEFLVGYAPGSMPEALEAGRAKLIKAGSDLVFQMHYTANGTPGTDRSKIGVIFATEPPKERVMTIAATNGKFVIPAGAANHEVDSKFTLKSDATLVSLFPHMHVRGKDFEYRVIYPSGEKDTLLRVPNYSFSWQLSYDLSKPLLLPKGTTIECTAHFDNSPNNKNNPDPGKEVRWGDQSWEEMMIGFMNVAFDAKMDPSLLFKEKKPSTSD